MITISFARHQFPPPIIRHAVWLYIRFTLNYRDVEELLAERGLEVLVTDKLGSCGAAKSELGLSARHEQWLRKNNQAENAHQPVRRREFKLQRFKSSGCESMKVPVTNRS